MRITALSRGGLSVFGGSYDPHRDVAIASILHGATYEMTVTIEYAAPPTDVTVTGGTASDPVITGNKVSFDLSGVVNSACTQVLATVGGETRVVQIAAQRAGCGDRYACTDERV